MGNNQETLSTVRNAIQILKEFSKGKAELGITDLSHRMGLSKSAVNRIVKTLFEENVLYKNPKTRKYRLGLTVFEIGSVVYNEFAIGQIAIPIIEKMKSALSGDIHLVIYDRGEIVYLLRLPEKINTLIKIGGRISCHATASGKVLLAYQSKQEIDRVLKNNLVAFTGNTITHPTDLLRELERIKSVGYAESKEEFNEGVYSIAVPIFNDFREVIAAISLTKDKFPSSKIQTEQIVRKLKLCSRLITENMTVNPYFNTHREG